MKKGIVIGASVLVIGVIATMSIAAATPEPLKEALSHVETSKTAENPVVAQEAPEDPQTTPQSESAVSAPVVAEPTFEERLSAYDFGLTAPEYFPPVVITLKNDYPTRFESGSIDSTFARLKVIFSNVRPQAYPQILALMRSDEGSFTVGASSNFEERLLTYKTQ